jgi:hypothetical protein
MSQPSEFANRAKYQKRQPIPVDQVRLGKNEEKSVLTTWTSAAPKSSTKPAAMDLDDSKELYGPVRTRGPGINRRTNASTAVTRYWMGTYFPNDAEQKSYADTQQLPTLRLDYQREDVTCWRGQWEWGGKNDKEGKLHAQFAVALRDQCRAPQARRILGGHYGPFDGYLEPAFSKNVWDYVTKAASRVAELPGYGALTDDSGHRSDLDILYEHIANGMPLWDVMSRFPKQFMRNHAAVSKLCAMYDKPRPYGPSTVEIWWGPTGTGKSHRAFHEYPEAYRKTIPGKWWEGYKGESVVVFEEFNPEEDKELRLPELLKILDKYPYQIEIKGASLQLRANHFIFTTNIDPRQWYNGHPQQPALARRIGKILVFTTSYAPGMSTAEFEEGIYEFPGMEGWSAPFQF